MNCEGPLSCALQQIVRELSQNDAFDAWALIVIPAIGAFGSIIVAVASWLTARRATRIAEGAANAEAARAKLESERVQESWRRDYEARLDDRLMLLIDELGQFGAAADEWAYQVSEVDIRWSQDPEEAPYPEKPSSAMLISRLQSSMLVGRDEDRIHLAQIDGYLGDVLRSKSFWKTSRRTRFLMETIRKWRDGSITGKTFAARIKRKRNAIELDIDAVDKTPKKVRNDT